MCVHFKAPKRQSNRIPWLCFPVVGATACIVVLTWGPTVMPKPYSFGALRWTWIYIWRNGCSFLSFVTPLSLRDFSISIFHSFSLSSLLSLKTICSSLLYQCVSVSKYQKGRATESLGFAFRWLVQRLVSLS